MCVLACRLRPYIKTSYVYLFNWFLLSVLQVMAKKWANGKRTTQIQFPSSISMVLMPSGREQLSARVCLLSVVTILRLLDSYALRVGSLCGKLDFYSSWFSNLEVLGLETVLDTTSHAWPPRWWRLTLPQHLVGIRIIPPTHTFLLLLIFLSCTYKTI